MKFSIQQYFKLNIFWKILLVFWLTTTLTIIANVYITKRISQVEQRFERVQNQLQNLAYDAVTVYESAGDIALQRWYEKVFQRQEIRLILLDTKNDPVGVPYGDNALDNHGHRHFSRMVPAPWSSAYTSLTNQTVLTSSGEKYTLKILPSPFIHNEMSSFHDYKIYRFLVSFFIIALGSLWLSRSVARPVKRLINASNLMASGDLSVRVKDSIGTRRDELGDLSAAFDHMAERVEGLLLNHRQLLRDISHEIRTPLTRQKLAIELAKSEGEDPKLFEKIEVQNEKLDSLITGILTYSRLSDGHQKMETSLIDSVSLIEQICEQANLECERKSIAIKQSLVAGAQFSGNEMLVTRAIDNLLGNALKYSPDGADITISTRCDSAYFIIQVKDQGPGINQAHMARIFEPFYRADDSRSQSTGGYGLGLAIVHKIMEQHGGSVELKNEGGLVATLKFSNID